MSLLPTIECPRCHASMSPDESCCPACGGGTRSLRTPTAATTSPAERRPLIDNPYAVLAAVFLAMAVFGIPLIWMCRVWSPFIKTVLTVVTLLYTALLLWAFWLVMQWCWARISGAM